MKSYAKWGIVFYFFFTAMIFPAVSQDILHRPPSAINGRIQWDTSSALGGSELEFTSKHSLFRHPIVLKLANIGEKDIGRIFDETVTGNLSQDAVPSESFANGARESEETTVSVAINEHAKFSENRLTIEPLPITEARQPTTLREEVFLYTRGVSGILGAGERARSDGPGRIFKWGGTQ
jgi:hypothetical protein